MAKEQFNLKSMTKAEREAHKDSFFIYLPIRPNSILMNWLTPA